MQKTAAFQFEKLLKEIGFEKYPQIPFSMNKKFSMHFQKKVQYEKSVSLKVLQLLLQFWEHRFINKVFLAAGSVPSTNIICCC